MQHGGGRNDDAVGVAVDLVAGKEVGGNWRWIGGGGKGAVVIGHVAHRAGTAVEAILRVPKPDREADGGDREQDTDDQSCFAQQHGRTLRKFAAMKSRSILRWLRLILERGGGRL